MSFILVCLVIGSWIVPAFLINGLQNDIEGLRAKVEYLSLFLEFTPPKTPETPEERALGEAIVREMRDDAAQIARIIEKEFLR